MRALLVTIAVACPACFPAVDVDKSDVEGYTDWYQVEASGKVPGHGDTIRVIYANDVAVEYGGAGSYESGSVLVKEIYQRRSGGARGDLDYIAVMRKLDEAPPGGELDGDWLFTIARDDIDGKETYIESCWSSCHVAAPYDGLFLQYGLK